MFPLLKNQIFFYNLDFLKFLIHHQQLKVTAPVEYNNYDNQAIDTAKEEKEKDHQDMEYGM